MTNIYYGLSGEEEWVVINEENSRVSVDKLKEFIERQIVIPERISVAYVIYYPWTRREDHTGSYHYQIHARGERGFLVDISCFNEFGNVDSHALGQCLELLGFDISDDEKSGNFPIAEDGGINECFKKK